MGKNPLVKHSITLTIPTNESIYGVPEIFSKIATEEQDVDFQKNRRIKKGWMNLRVSEIVEETPDTKTFVFEDHEEGGRQIDYFAGQYLTFRYDGISEKPLVRSYTMSSAPSRDDLIRVTVKRVEQGKISNWMCDSLETGSVLRARGPIGRFCYDPEIDQKNVIMVAGGSGVTPFVSIMKEYGPILGQPGSPESLVLLVSYRSKQDLICWPELTAIARLPGCRVVTTLSREDAQEEGFWKGRIDAAMIDRLTGGKISETTFMTCGPDAIMDAMVNYCKDLGVPDSCVKKESFEN